MSTVMLVAHARTAHPTVTPTSHAVTELAASIATLPVQMDLRAGSAITTSFLTTGTSTRTPVSSRPSPLMNVARTELGTVLAVMGPPVRPPNNAPSVALVGPAIVVFPNPTAVGTSPVATERAAPTTTLLALMGPSARTGVAT